MIWKAAVHLNWTGNLSTLPKSGFPATSTGLCDAPISKQFYERLCNLQPHLDHRKEDNTGYGVIRSNHLHEGLQALPIVFQDDERPSSGGPSGYNDFDGVSIFGWGVSLIAVVREMDSSLVNIPLRMCWMDLIEDYIRLNPINMAAYAIVMNHFQLLKHMVEDMNIVRLKDLETTLNQFREENNPYLLAAQHGNLEMVKFLFNHGFPNLPSANILLEKPIEYGYMDILKYVQNELCHEMYREAVLDAFGYTSHMEVWEWHMDLCAKNNEESKLIPIPTNMKSVKRILKRMAKKPLIKYTLIAVANQGRLDLFEPLWKHQVSVFGSAAFPDVEGIDTTNTNLENIMAHFVSITFNHILGSKFGFPSIEALDIAHKQITKPACNVHSLITTLNKTDNDPLHFICNLYEICQCHTQRPWLDYYLSSGGQDLRIVEFLYARYRKTLQSRNPLYIAAELGYFNVVKYLCENERKKKWTDKDIAHIFQRAVFRGYIDIVEYLHVTKGFAYPDDLTSQYALQGRLDIIQ
ncbi:hypothetical protein HDU76_005107, partial [Blyttiomyces sp. JEL0837]